MSYNFDKIIPRRNTDSCKFDGYAKRGKPADALPLWVADTDFAAPDYILDALRERLDHGVFGYAEPQASYFDALKTWFTDGFGYKFDNDWVSVVPGVVYGFASAIRAATAPGDSIIIQQPLYAPIKEAIVVNGRRAVISELVNNNGHYDINFADFENQIIKYAVRAFILCNPHNPVGRVFERDELLQMVEICRRHDVIIISDEIHCDLIFGGRQHHVLPAIAPDYAHRMILCTSPSKTFNLAGLQNANIFTSDPHLRARLNRDIYKSGYSQCTIMGLIAARAAYTGGREWVDAMVGYIWKNFEFMEKFLGEHLPKVRLTPIQGTYLAWLDFRQYGHDPAELNRRITDDARLWLSSGESFGAVGAGFQRINMGCPQSTLQECLTRLAKVI